MDFQVHRWEAARARKPKGTVESASPVITISREYGSRGSAIAQALGTRLDWTCWDQELVHELAKNTDVSDRIVATVDEHRHNVIAGLINSFVHGDSLDESIYLRELIRIIHVIEHHGQAVIVGRGAHYIVSPEAAFRVRIISPIEARIQDLIERRAIDAKEARAEIARVDAERRDFMLYHYQRDIDDPHSFDLIVNVGTWTVEQARNIIIAAYEARFGKVGG